MQPVFSVVTTIIKLSPGAVYRCIVPPSSIMLHSIDPTGTWMGDHLRSTRSVGFPNVFFFYKNKQHKKTQHSKTTQTKIKIPASCSNNSFEFLMQDLPRNQGSKIHKIKQI